MLKTPGRKYRQLKPAKINLIPILDAIFIFIFFLLTSANLINLYEINSDVPIISQNNPPKDKKPPLGLTLQLKKDSLILRRGEKSVVVSQIKNVNKEYNLTRLHEKLIRIKKVYPKEQDIIIESSQNITYEVLVKIMDAVRVFRPTDEALFQKVDGIDTKVKNLFNKIIINTIE